MRLQAKIIAQYLLKYCKDKERLITNFHIQVMLYYIQMKSLQQLNQPAFREDLQAWKIFPVVPWVYYDYAMYGARPISKDCHDVVLPNNLKKIANLVADKIMDMTIWKMRELYSASTTPYSITRKKYKDNKNIIQKELLKSADIKIN